MLKQRIEADMKAALKSGDKRRLGVVRLILAAVKQREIDERTELDDPQVLAVLDKMVKQRRDSVAQYEQAGRTDLAETERYEIDVCQHYMPEAIDDAALAELVTAAIRKAGAASMKDMGKVMAELRPQVQGRADMASVSALVKKQLNG